MHKYWKISFIKLLLAWNFYDDPACTWPTNTRVSTPGPCHLASAAQLQLNHSPWDPLPLESENANLEGDCLGNKKRLQMFLLFCNGYFEQSLLNVPGCVGARLTLAFLP